MLIRDRRTFDAEGGSGGAGGGSDPGGADPGATAWYSGKVDQETLGHWQNKGWDVTNPATVASEATKAWKAAEQAHLTLTGVPADRLLRMPAPGDEAATRAFHQKLGAPIDATGYDFSSVKRADGTAVDGAMTGTLAASFLKLGISKDAATEIVKQVQGLTDGVASATNADRTAKTQGEMMALRQSWGQNAEANMFVARQAAQKLGFTADEANALGDQVGHGKVLEMLRRVGSELGESRFVGAGPGGNPGPMTQEQAVARLADLKKDDGWVKKYLAGDVGAKRELDALSRMKLGPIDESARPVRFAR